MGTPHLPLGIGPPNELTVTVGQGDSALDLTTVTAVTLYATKTLTGDVSVWPCTIASGATATELVASYPFTRPAASGTFGVIAGQLAVTSSLPNSVPVGALVWFASQPGIFYTVAANSAQGLTLATPYTGPTNAATGATYTLDANVLGTYDIAVALTVPSGIVPAYAFPVTVAPPQQTYLHSP